MGRSNTETAVKDSRRNTRRKFSTEEQIRIVLDGLRGESWIAALCRRARASIPICITAGARISWQLASSGSLAILPGQPTPMRSAASSASIPTLSRRWLSCSCAMTGSKKV